MAENTKISWATHTFNQWLGCQHATIPVSRYGDTYFDSHPGCKNCYAEAMSGRFGVQWGPASEGGTRRRTAESTWRQVEKWNRNAECWCKSSFSVSGYHDLGCPQNERNRPRVFPSACDPFEHWIDLVSDSDRKEWRMQKVRNDFFAIIDRTQNLDWLLLTKRPQNVRRMWTRMKVARGIPAPLSRPNVWLLYSASDQRSLEAGLPYLLECRDLVPVLGLSLEPLVGPVVIPPDALRILRWVICGGESGPHARPCEVQWIRDIVDQCRAAGVPCFVKQDSGRFPGQQGRIPDDLWQVKEFPRG